MAIPDRAGSGIEVSRKSLFADMHRNAYLPVTAALRASTYKFYTAMARYSLSILYNDPTQIDADLHDFPMRRWGSARKRDPK
jgi:hypothetical protein